MEGLPSRFPGWRRAQGRTRRFELNSRSIGALVLLLPLLAGCVERRYTIRTDPPGALAIVNGEEIGPTPVSRSFTYYGDREVTLLMDGYKAEQQVVQIKPPWWDNLLTEFVTENLIPITFRDEREYRYRLRTEANPQSDDLLRRAEQLRGFGHAPPPARQPTFWERLGFGGS